jgi:hypothetical protein
MAQELSHCLNQLSDGAVAQIGSQYGCQTRNELCRALLQVSHFTQAWEQLDQVERQVFLSFLFAARAGAVSEREGEVWARERRLSHSAWQRTVVGLVRRGWIYAFRDKHRQRIYMCPLEIRQLLSRVLFKEDVETWHGQGDVSVEGEPSYGLGQALFHLLARLEQEPWRLTRTVGIHKTDAQKMDVELGLASEALRHTPWWGTEMPPWVAFLLDLGRQLGLIAEDGQILTVDASCWQQWTDQDWEEMMNGLYWATRELLSRRIPGLEADFLLMEEVEPRQWLPLSQWKAIKRCWYREKGRKAREYEERLDAFVAVMTAAGWLETGLTKSGERCVRLTEMPPWQQAPLPEMPIYVQPDMELIVPGHFPPSQRRQLEQLADFMGGEQVLFYLITEESLHRARRRGMTTEQQLDFLTAWSGQPVPDGVARKIRDEAKRSSLVFCEALVQYALPLSLPRERITPHLSAWQAVLMEDGRLLVPQTKKEVVDRWLTEAGLEVVERKRESRKAPENAARVTGGHDRMHDWQMEENLPDPDAVSRGFEHLPKLWWSGMRAYRLPMKRELLQHGIHSGLRVKVECGGERQVLYPLRVEERSGDWWLTAERSGREVRLPLARLEKLQLIDE